MRRRRERKRYGGGDLEKERIKDKGEIFLNKCVKMKIKREVHFLTPFKGLINLLKELRNSIFFTK